MKKHILGFAIFSFIIVSAIFVEAFYFSPAGFDVPSPQVNSSCWKMKREVVIKTYPKKIERNSPISYKIQDWSYNSDTNVFNAKVRLNWNGNENPPAAVVVQLKFFTLDNPIYEIPVASETIRNPFADGNSTATRMITTVVKNSELIDSYENYYGTINTWNLEDNSDSDSSEVKGRMTIFAPTGDEKMAQAVPVLMIHKK